ncbi:MAG: ElyC/SanA/YdcF family protein [Verrucomicrobiales bacterium]|nr:ElyC/SanA/YdcF family protein [Verrucomicrobiales bacterium]
MDFWFVFKKITAIGLTPISITLELVIIGLLLVGFSRGTTRKKPHPRWLWFKGISGDLGGIMIWTAAAFLYFCSIEAVAYGLNGLLEKKYPVLETVTSEPEYIVVLPGGHRYSNEHADRNSKIQRKTFVRLMKGIEYWRQHPDSTLVFSGLPSEVRPMRDISKEMGVPTEKIFTETEARDTKDHPRYLKGLLAGKSFLLVTSGNHMPRAVGLFKGQGLAPTPAPTDLHYSTNSTVTLRQLIPQGRYLLITDEAFHEHLGIGWAALRQQIQERNEARVAFRKTEAEIKQPVTSNSSILDL